jgi:hypothetical protein
MGIDPSFDRNSYLAIGKIEHERRLGQLGSEKWRSQLEISQITALISLQRTISGTMKCRHFVRLEGECTIVEDEDGWPASAWTGFLVNVTAAA